MAENQYASVGQPVEGGCAWTNFKDSPALPDDAVTKMKDQADWEDLGEFSDNGYTKSVSVDSNKFKGWHGSVILSQVAGEENTFKVELTDIDRPTVAKLRYGVDAVKLDTDGKIKSIDPKTVPNAEIPIIIDELLSNGRLRRTVFPRVKIDSIDDEGHQKGALLVYGFTFTASVDSKGRPYYIREAKPAAVPGV